MFEKIKTIIEETVDTTGVIITPDTTLLTDLNINSLDLVELVCAFEVAYEVEVDEKDMRKLSKVQDIIDYLESH